MAGVKTLSAKKALVRYIRDGQIPVGGKLPAQGILRQELGLGGTTIAAAIKELQDEQILEVRDKVGVFVLKSDTDGHIGRTIGLAVNDIWKSAYRYITANLLQVEMMQRGWQLFNFLGTNQTVGRLFDIHDFPGLHRAIETHEIEALVTMGEFDPASVQFFNDHQLPTLYIGALVTSLPSISIDLEAFAKAGLEELAKANCTKPALMVNPNMFRHQKEFIDHIQCPIYMTPMVPKYDKKDFSSLFNLAPEERPDGLVFLDDTLASHFCGEKFMAGLQDYQPKIVTIRHIENIFLIPSPEPVYFDISLTQMVHLAIDQLWNKFNHQIELPENMKYKPQKYVPQATKNSFE